MQAIIMAAGVGRRLGNLLSDKPKSFLEIRERKLIEYNLKMLSKYNINDITIVSGYKHSEFERLLCGADNIRLVFNPFYEMTNVLASFWFGQHNLHDKFIYMHADTLCEPSIFEDLLKTDGDVILPVDFKKCDEEAMKVKLGNNNVVEINKTMKIEEADGEFIGIAKISKECLNNLKEISTNAMIEKNFSLFFESALQEIIDNNLFSIKTFPTNNRFWCEIDFIEDYNRAKKAIPNSLIFM